MLPLPFRSGHKRDDQEEKYASANGTIIYKSTIADPYGKGYLWQKIATVTMRLTSIRIPPYFFWDVAATTLARLSPQAGRLIRPVLVHSDFRTTERP